ncbi:oxidoreductase [Paludibacterium yongneupense]|uniref:oxidoreductase n=1 Tax=Paludibacterium yongneupense TaxID=400061 RepID=UPI00040C1ED9|nr:oxidoreductase [Paludibacterium yongneupense]
MSTLHAGLIGYGYAGRTLHAPLLAHTPGIRLAAIHTSKGELAHADWPQATVYDEAEALFADAGIELIVIATPNDSHYPLARQALLAGKHVVVDKPFTVTLDEARELAELARARGLLLSVFHNRRWDSDFLTLKSLIEQDVVGRVVQFESHFDRFRPQVVKRWREQAGAGAGLWFDLGPHLVDQALQLFGAPAAVFGDMAGLREGAQTTDYFHVLLRYPDKRIILHGATLVSGGAARYALHGTRGSYTKYGLDTQEADLKRGGRPGDEGWGCDPRPGTLFTQHDGEEQARPHPNLAGDYRDYYQAVHTAIEGNAPNPVTPQEAIEVMAVIELAIASASSGHELPLLPESGAGK